jgi:ABC-type Mn2+/Zn2+ transport system permease subunit
VETYATVHQMTSQILGQLRKDQTLSDIFKALIAAAFGACATLGGLAASLHWDTPTGPSIICCAAALFFISTLLGALRGRGLS